MSTIMPMVIKVVNLRPFEPELLKPAAEASAQRCIPSSSSSPFASFRSFVSKPSVNQS